MQSRTAAGACAPALPRLLLLRDRLDPRQEAELDHLRLAGLAHHLVDERLRVCLVLATRHDADPVLHLPLRPRRHLDHLHLARHVRASVEYTKPASASPSATFDSTSRTSVSRLTT